MAISVAKVTFLAHGLGRTGEAGRHFSSPFRASTVEPPEVSFVVKRRAVVSGCDCLTCARTLGAVILDAATGLLARGRGPCRAEVALLTQPGALAVLEAVTDASFAAAALVVVPSGWTGKALLVVDVASVPPRSALGGGRGGLGRVDLRSVVRTRAKAS
eukprot:CAMPEP_0197573108 /NCGR_PEP_ID=MMETSP1320-20131121/42796_1 /TAXON_ID=91990 /ORGANISM="Bolidomonas sp., Strain RCC2347" /LENGTH=158 /DNA_ID=CAMNT_0043135617 /DNA_START=1435 /DNA_END=1911 /DNA_ORIENTATION=+